MTVTNNFVKGMARMLTPALVTTLYYLVRDGAKISPHAEVDLTSNLKFGPGSVVGSFTKIKSFDGPTVFGARAGVTTGCFFAAGERGIYIGDNFICGANVNIVAASYNYDQQGKHLADLGSTSKGIKIGSNVWVGSGTTITDGASIGNDTIIAANSLVNRRYPDAVLLQGNPAKIVMKR